MKRLFTLLAALLLGMSTTFAQRNLYCWESGNVYIEPASQIDSLTLGLGIQLFQISKPINLGATTNSFQGSTKVSLNENIKSIDVAPEVGICYSEENSKPTCADMILKLGSAMQEYSFTIKDFVTSGTTYHYRTYVRLLDEIYYGPINTITTMGDKPVSKVINGHQFIDLGLPSGLLWAETNIGATFSSDDGEYFAWGETETKENYSWSTYKWGEPPSKYTYKDVENTLESEDDVATIKWGKGCRMPSRSEIEELCNACSWTWRTNYNNYAKGYLVTGPNGNSIFIPVSGLRSGNTDIGGETGHYWLRNFYPGMYTSAYSLYFYKGYIYNEFLNYRDYGCSVRPVAVR